VAPALESTVNVAKFPQGQDQPFAPPCSGYRQGALPNICARCAKDMNTKSVRRHLPFKASGLEAGSVVGEIELQQLSCHVRLKFEHLASTPFVRSLLAERPPPPPPPPRCLKAVSMEKPEALTSLTMSLSAELSPLPNKLHPTGSGGHQPQNVLAPGTLTTDSNLAVVHCFARPLSAPSSSNSVSGSLPRPYSLKCVDIPIHQ
jgi:hypothetical protein